MKKSNTGAQRQIKGAAQPGRFATCALMGFVAAYGVLQPTDAQAAILLSENNVQGHYSIVDDATRDGYEIMCTLQWANDSANVDANNQISANGTFGSNMGLYEINTDEYPHDDYPPTYTIHPDSFEIEYADGVVNKPNQSDTFKFFFSLGEGVPTEADAQEIVDGLNGLIDDPSTYTEDAAWKFKRSINGTVAYGGDPQPFENSPTAFVPGFFDTNRVPYLWYAQYGHTNLDVAGLLDDDADGFLNWQEYHADTNPTNSESYLAIGICGTNLAFAASSNCSYAVDWSDTLSSNAWNTLVTNLPGTNGTLTLNDTNAAPVRFFRLKAQRK